MAALPTSPTTVQKTIPSYLYWEYSDDSDLQAFVSSFNAMAQQYVNTFNALNLPVYTGDLISGALLDWVATGIYGQKRPVLLSGATKYLGVYSTSPYDTISYNGLDAIGPANYYVTTDDIYKRILTWNLYRGDGQTFSVRWLKRRIMRFLLGVGGADPGINQTYQISVSFGINDQVNIRIVNGIRTVTSGMYNTISFNAIPFGAMNSTFQSFPGFEFAPSLKSAILSGAVQLPFQYTYTVSI